MHDCQMISIDKLERCPIQLRSVKKRILDYVMLSESIRTRGILVSLLVRPIGDMFQIVNGGNRYEISLDLYIQYLPCVIVEMTDKEVLENQIITHLSRIEAKPVEYCRRLWQLIYVEEGMTIDELAHSLKRHQDWVRKVLKLVRLSDRAQEELKKGLITMQLAAELVKLPTTTQDEILESREELTNRELIDISREEARHVNESKKSKRHSKNINKVYRYRQMKEVISEFENPTVAASVIMLAGAKTPDQIWKATLGWALTKDEASIMEDIRLLEKQKDKEANLLKRRIAEHQKKDE